MNCKFLSLLAAATITFASCSKKDSAPVVPDPPKAKMTINFNVQGADAELVISEPGGKILLDSLVHGISNLHAELVTDEKLVDVTYIQKFDNLRRYVTSYLGVDPTAWKTGYPVNGPDFKTSKSSSRKSISYQNLPANSYDPALYFSYWFSGYANGFCSFDAPVGNNLSLMYDLYPGNYAYLLLPKVGMYKLTTPVNDGEVVDLSTMDTAIQANFILPSYFKYASSGLDGVLDTTDFSTAMSFYHPLVNSDLSNLLYPSLPCQKYLTTVNTTSLDGKTMYSASAYADSVKLNQDFFQPGDWQVASHTSDNFTINFPGSKPSFYQVNYENDSINCYITASPEAGTIHPQTFLTNLKARLLKDQPTTGLAITHLFLYTINDLNYKAFLEYGTDPSKITPSSLVKMKWVTTGPGALRIGKTGEISRPHLTPFGLQ